jgi:hypothetical protein
MLRHKAMIQAARLAFGYGGIFDQDEAERIAESDVSVKSSRNPADAAANNVPDGYAEFEAEHLQTMRDAALNGSEALAQAFNSLPKGAHKTAFWQAYQTELKAAAQAATVIDAETGEVTA